MKEIKRDLLRSLILRIIILLEMVTAADRRR